MRIKVNSKAAVDNIVKRFNEFQNDQASLDLIAKRLVRNNRADAINGVDSKWNSFPVLSPGWIKRKARLLTVNSPSKHYSYGKSNLSFMGDLLNAISYKLSGNEIILIISGTHRKIMGMRGKYLKGSDADLSEVYDGLASRDKTWGFLGVSIETQKYARTLFRRFLRRN